MNLCGEGVSIALGFSLCHFHICWVLTLLSTCVAGRMGFILAVLMGNGVEGTGNGIDIVGSESMTNLCAVRYCKYTSVDDRF